MELPPLWPEIVLLLIFTSALSVAYIPLPELFRMVLDSENMNEVPQAQMPSPLLLSTIELEIRAIPFLLTFSPICPPLRVRFLTRTNT